MSGGPARSRPGGEKHLPGPLIEPEPEVLQHIQAQDLAKQRLSAESELAIEDQRAQAQPGRMLVGHGTSPEKALKGPGTALKDVQSGRASVDPIQETELRPGVDKDWHVHFVGAKGEGDQNSG